MHWVRTALTYLAYANGAGGPAVLAHGGDYPMLQAKHVVAGMPWRCCIMREEYTRNLPVQIYYGE